MPARSRKYFATCVTIGQPKPRRHCVLAASHFRIYHHLPPLLHPPLQRHRHLIRLPPAPFRHKRLYLLPKSASFFVTYILHFLFVKESAFAYCVWWASG